LQRINSFLLIVNFRLVLIFIFGFTSLNVFGQMDSAIAAKYDYSIIRNQNKLFGRKFLQGSALVFGYESISLAILYASPSSFSNWQKPTAKNYRENLKRAFTKPPVIDNDKWYINYLGHPYQGACTYNALRSQGATMWQSGLFAIGHSFVWEYLIEGGNEQPSVQDIFVTPLTGIVFGELIHLATMEMSRNGFKWYEGVFVAVFNPMFLINNGLKRNRSFKKP